LLSIKTFGGIRIKVKDKLIPKLVSRKAYALIAYVVAKSVPVPRETLSNIFWPNQTQKRSSANLRVVLSSIKKILGTYLEIERDYVSLKNQLETNLDLIDI